MSTLPTPQLTATEYLAKECSSEIKHEFYAGQMFAMAGASREHNLIVANLVAALHLQLKDGPCEVYPSDMRLKVNATGLYTYPDASVVCDDPQFEDAEVDTLLNPLLVAEVLSESTESYDRGKKSAHYRRLESLQDYLIIAQSEPQVEHYSRQDDGYWLISDASGLEAEVALPSIGCTLRLADLYARISFPAEESR